MDKVVYRVAGMRLEIKVLKTKIQRQRGPYLSGHNLNLMILIFHRYGLCKWGIYEIGKEQLLIKVGYTGPDSKPGVINS